MAKRGDPSIKEKGKKTRFTSGESAVKNGRKGAIVSNEVQKKKRETSQLVEMILDMPVQSKTAETLKKLGFKDEDLTNEVLLLSQQYTRAVKGDTRSAEFLYRYKELTASEKANYEIKKANLKLEKEKHKMEMEAYKKLHEDKGNNYKGIPALLIAPPFASILHDINEHAHTEYDLTGGRGSTKSSFISLVIVHLIMTNPLLNALVMRQVGNTIKDSVYNQIIWAIEQLDLIDEFHCVAKPAEITRIATGQKIFFRGADDPMKVKSLKAIKGYLGVLWLEELDQFTGPESVRKIEQSAIRGGDEAYIFKSFNPPRSAINWANKYVLLNKPNRLVHQSTYLDVPKSWLGKPFIEEAEFLKQINPIAFENEYMGVANGTGGSVFDNLEIREITDEEIDNFDYVYHGVDWGWYPDPYNYSQVSYNPTTLTLYVFREYRCKKKSNRETADVLINDFNIEDQLVICDSEDMKSVGDYQAYGIKARGAEKGPGSVNYSFKWLQSLVKIVIDPVRCPNATKEFTEYEYPRDKDGNVISEYPDKDNHSIDSVRYATNSIWKRRGQ